MTLMFHSRYMFSPDALVLRIIVLFLQENYGKKDPSKVAIIKQLYKELNLEV